MKRRWPVLLVWAGFSLLACGFAWNVMFAGIPYQDPPPELAARYAWHARFSSMLGWAGVLTLVTGFIPSIVRMFREHRI